MTPRKMATDLKMPRHNLAHFCYAKFCRSKFRLIPIPDAVQRLTDRDAVKGTNRSYDGANPSRNGSDGGVRPQRTYGSSRTWRCRNRVGEGSSDFWSSSTPLLMLMEFSIGKGNSLAVASPWPWGVPSGDPGIMALRGLVLGLGGATGLRSSDGMVRSDSPLSKAPVQSSEGLLVLLKCAQETVW